VENDVFLRKFIFLLKTLDKQGKRCYNIKARLNVLENKEEFPFSPYRE